MAHWKVPQLPRWVGARPWPWPELPVLLALLATAALVWMFIELADEVAGGDTHEIDQRALDMLRDPERPGMPRGPAWLVDAGRDVTALGSPAVLTLVVAAATGYLLLEGRRRSASLLLAAVLSGVILSSFLKSAFDRPRPPAGSLWQGTATASFPSGHSLSSAVVYLTLGAMLARAAATRRQHWYMIGVALALTLLVGASRVYLGVHYPSDVLAGWTAGAAWALVWWLVARKAEGREPKVEG